MAQQSEEDIKKLDIIDNIDAYSYKAKVKIENQAESLRYKVKDILREASQKAASSIFNDRNGEERVKGIAKLCKDGINFPPEKNFIAFYPEQGCEFGNVIHLEKGLDSLSWKKAKKFDTSMVVEGLCTSSHTKSIYIALCNNEESFSCIYKTSLSGKFPVRILESDKRIKDVASENGVLYAANYTDDEIIVANEIDYDFHTWVELENVWGLYAVDQNVLAISKDTIVRYNVKKDILWKSLVKNACRLCVLGDLIYVTRMGNSGLTILKFKSGCNIHQIENSLLRSPLGVCEFFAEGVLVANNERKSLDLLNNKGQISQSITLKFEPSFVRLSVIRNRIIIYVVDSESATVHFFYQKD